MMHSYMSGYLNYSDVIAICSIQFEIDVMRHL